MAATLDAAGDAAMPSAGPSSVNYGELRRDICRERMGRAIGRLDETDIARLNVALAFVMGLAD